METYTLPIPLPEIHIIVLRPNDDEPGILSLYADGTRRLNVFGDDAECDAFWATIEGKVRNEDFVRYHGIMFRAEELKMLEKCRTDVLGHYLHFIFHNTFEFRQQYDDEQTLDNDLSAITDILGTLQDIRASKRTSPTKQ